MARDENFPSLGFRLYWAAAAVSGLGTYVTLLALQALVVLTLDGSATDVGWLTNDVDADIGHGLHCAGLI